MTGSPTLTYRLVMATVSPIVRWWGRLEVTGEELLPESGAALLIVNHDSAWDPLVVGVAAVRRRQIGALAKSSLWRVRALGWILDRMGQLPIERGRGDTQAMQAAITRLADGGCIGVFPEGTVSRGRVLRARSGAGRLALAVPDLRVVCVAVTGAVDIVRFPTRPQLRVIFFEPAGGQPAPGETATGVTTRLLAEIRAIAPPALPGRPKQAAQFRHALDTGPERT